MILTAALFFYCIFRTTDSIYLKKFYFLKSNKVILFSSKMLRQLLLKSRHIYCLNVPRFYTNQPLSLLSLSNEKVQKYLENISNEFYVLKVSDNIDKTKRRRLAMLSHIVELFEQRKCVLENINSLKELKDEKDDEMVKLMEEEREVYTKIVKKLDGEIIDAILLIDDTPDYGSIVLEVTAGVGGQEAMLFAREIFDMYCNYVEFKGWNSDIIQLEHSDVGGVRHGSMIVSGEGAFKHLQFEGGVHRVQRIPTTEKSGRIHTSTVTVAIIPRPDDFHLTIKDKDLKIETKRASGAGGQHVNTTDSAVRIVHLPTGIAVESQSERSQLKNKEICLKKLESKILQQELNKQHASEAATRKSQVGQSFRNEKIRTYNYNQDRISDHRIENGTTYNLKGFLEGGLELDQLIVKVSAANRENELQEIIKSFAK